MQNKQIVFTAVNTAELLDIPMPEPKAGEVLVKLAVSTISSGTERANVSGSDTVSFGGPPNISFPRYGGYSSAGTVLSVGEGVTEFKVGDRVILSWSTHSRYICMPVENVTKIEDDSLTFSEAALLHIGTFPMAAIRKCRLEIGEPAIVMGMGVLGIMATLLLRAAGAAPLIAADPSPEKRAKALELGADYALDPFDPDFAATVKKITGGGVRVAIEVTGVGQGLNTVLDCMRQFGRVALLGCTRKSDFTVDFYRKVHGPGITLIGAHTNARPVQESSASLWTTHDDILAEMRLIACGRLNVKQLVEEVHSPAECSEIYLRLCTEKTFPIVQFDWSELD